jgi:hypothetical protein
VPCLARLQVDGYAGYGKLAERGDVQLAFCWSHMRRNFYELAAPGPAPIAGEALKHIALPSRPLKTALTNDQEYSYMLRGNLTAARRQFEQAYSLDPGNPVIANNLELWQPAVH